MSEKTKPLRLGTEVTAAMTAEDVDLMPLARNIVSQLGDLYMDFTHPATIGRAEFVKYRQATNDQADEFVLRLLRTVRTNQAQIATQEPAGAAQGGSGNSRTLADRLRAAADYQDRPGAYDELRAMADEVHRLEVHARVIEQSLRTARQEGS